MRPGLLATQQAVGELASQNQALRSLVADAEQVTGQAAAHSRELASLVDSLSATLGETAEHGEALDRGLAALPETAGQAEKTLTRLRGTAVAATPLAEALEDGAPDLAESLKRLGPFLTDTRSSMASLQPTVDQTAELLRQARPTLQAAPERVLTSPFELTGGVDDLLRALLGNEDVLTTLFGADAYGAPPGNAGDVGLGSIGVEHGDQAGYPGNDPARNFLRAMVIPSCEVFGLKIAPGCLAEAIDSASGTRGGHSGAGEGKGTPGADSPSPGTDANGSPAQTGGGTPGDPVASGAPVPGPSPGAQPGGPINLLDFLFGT